MKDILAGVIFALLLSFFFFGWRPTVVIQHGSAPPDTIRVTYVRR